jgi:hypothetical protein
VGRAAARASKFDCDRCPLKSNCCRSVFNKCLAGRFQNRGSAGFALVTAQDDVDVEWIEVLDAAAAAAGSLGGNQGRARSQERIEHDVPMVDLGLLQQSEDTPILERGCAGTAGYSGRWAPLREPNPRRFTSSLRI